MNTDAHPPGHGLARALSKLGVCSRSQAWKQIEAGRVTVNGVVCCDPERRIRPGRDQIELDGHPLRAAERVYIALNKPRGLVTSASDEQGRDTVFECLRDARLPHVVPVGRLDKASEGLLLLTNDTDWAAWLTAPGSHVDKVYHVQVNTCADEAVCRRIETGMVDAGERLGAKRAALLRHGTRNSWIEIVLDEGRNRHLRRLLAALGIEVLRLVRVRIGPLELGQLPKGGFRRLRADEVDALAKRSAQVPGGGGSQGLSKSRVAR